MSDNSLNKTKQIWKPKGKLSDNSLNKTKQIWKPKGKLSDNSLNKTKQVWKATGKLFANVGYQWRSTGKKVALGKLNCGYQWRPTGKKFALGELCPLTKLSVQCSIITANQQDPNTNWGSEVSNPPNSTVFNAGGLAPQCLKMFDHSSSSLGLHCQKTFKQISSNLVSQMSQRRLLASLQAPFLKEKKGVRFSALYLHQKRNLLVLDHSHQQIRKGNLLLDLQKLQMNPIFRISVDIFVRAFTTSANRSLLHDNIVPKPDLALELGKSISLTEVEEEAIAREIPLFVSKKRSSDSSKKFKGIQTLTPAKQEAADIMKALKESKKMSKRQAWNREASNEGNCEHFDRDDNARDDNEETKPDHKEIDNHVALAGPNPEHMQDVFLATNYPKGGANKDLEILFQPMFDEYFEQSTDSEPVPTATVVNAPIVSTNTSVSTSIAQDAPSTSHSLSSLQVHPPVFPQGVAAGPTIEDTSITQADLHPSVNPVAGEPGYA
ncbi:hypothetical protein Tco_1032409 [Tanacetum coccineum]|uniref:Uncharacterized protein n=1 Tax=Tanacetum coccineum TaxID=301880 RepID=A0ABQ5GBS3_9ASTR